MQPAHRRALADGLVRQLRRSEPRRRRRHLRHAGAGHGAAARRPNPTARGGAARESRGGWRPFSGAGRSERRRPVPRPPGSGPPDVAASDRLRVGLGGFRCPVGRLPRLPRPVAPKPYPLLAVLHRGQANRGACSQGSPRADAPRRAAAPAADPCRPPCRSARAATSALAVESRTKPLPAQILTTHRPLSRPQHPLPCLYRSPAHSSVARPDGLRRWHPSFWVWDVVGFVAVLAMVGQGCCRAKPPLGRKLCLLLVVAAPRSTESPQPRRRVAPWPRSRSACRQSPL